MRSWSIWSRWISETKNQINLKLLSHSNRALTLPGSEISEPQKAHFRLGRIWARCIKLTSDMKIIFFLSKAKESSHLCLSTAWTPRIVQRRILTILDPAFLLNIKVKCVFLKFLAGIRYFVPIYFSDSGIDFLFYILLRSKKLVICPSISQSMYQFQLPDHFWDRVKIWHIPQTWISFTNFKGRKITHVI